MDVLPLPMGEIPDQLMGEGGSRSPGTRYPVDAYNAGEGPFSFRDRKEEG